MKIGILNEAFLTKDHLERLNKLGEVEELLDTDSADKAKERIKDKDIIISDMFISPLTNDILEHGNNLKLIALNTTAFHKVDLEYANNKNIKVSNTPGFSTDSVAEQVFALLFALARKTIITTQDFRDSPFEIFPDVPEHRKYLGFNLRGKIMGVIGTGNIGSRVCEIAKALGMKVIAYNRSQKKLPGVEFTSFEDVLKRSDMISINTPLNDESKNLFNKNSFSMMKNSSVIINTTSEEIINFEDLVKALDSKEISGVAFDHVSIRDKKHPLMNRDNVIIAPMAGWFTQESLDNIGEIIVESIEAFVKGENKNIVN